MMKNTNSPVKKRMNYFAVLKGVKLPWLIILLSFAFSIIMMRAELQIATLTSDIIDTSQKAINGSKLINHSWSKNEAVDQDHASAHQILR